MVALVVAGTVLFGGPASPVLDKLGVSPLLGSGRTAFSQALDLVPRDAQRVSFTDWGRVRSTLDVDLGAGSDRAAVDAMASTAYERDLAAVSSIDESAGALQEFFGFSPATISWEAFAQGRSGATMVVQLPDDLDPDVVREHLEDLGYTEPEDANGVWLGGIDLTAAIDPTITPLLQYVAVVDDLVVSSDSEDYATKAAKVAAGDGASLGELDAAREVVDPLDDLVAATFWARDFACEDLSVSSSDPQDQELAAALVAQAGKISPLTGLVMALRPDRTLVVSELFETDEVARENLGARAKLAVGEAPGRGGSSFSDELELVSSETDGSAVRLLFEPRDPDAFVLSAFDHGPVLFATC